MYVCERVYMCACLCVRVCVCVCEYVGVHTHHTTHIYSHVPLCVSFIHPSLSLSLSLSLSTPPLSVLLCTLLHSTQGVDALTRALRRYEFHTLRSKRVVAAGARQLREYDSSYKQIGEITHTLTYCVCVCVCV
jgi:hypothetical protein